MERTFFGWIGRRLPGLGLGTWLIVVVWPLVGADAAAWEAIRPVEPVGPNAERGTGFTPVWRVLGEAAVPRGLERELLADAADGSLDRFSLLGAALVAGGVDNPRSLNDYQAKAADLVRRWRESGQVSGTPREKAQRLFELMHACCLRGGYRFDCTSLAHVLDEGRFNCVSASVLFCCFAREFGLDVRGLEVPGHAMSCLVLPEETLPIESTCPNWFRLSADPGRRADLLRRTMGQTLEPGAESAQQVGERVGEKIGLASTSDSNAAPFLPPHRQVSSVALVATIYYNRGVDLLAEKRFAQAAVANLKALDLDPANETARGNLLATLNNWAIHEGSQGRFREAAALLSVGMAVAPDFKTFAVNQAHLHREWLKSLKK